MASQGLEAWLLLTTAPLFHWGDPCLTCSIDRSMHLRGVRTDHSSLMSCNSPALSQLWPWCQRALAQGQQGRKSGSHTLKSTRRKNNLHRTAHWWGLTKLITKTTHYQYPQIKWLLRVQFGNHRKPWTACPTRWRFSKDLEDSVIGTHPFSFLSFFCPGPHGTNGTVTLWVVGGSLLRTNSIVCTTLFKWESQWFFTFNLKILFSLRSQS